jgi:hypothetical protein
MKSIRPLLLALPVPPILLYTAEHVMNGAVPTQYAVLTVVMAVLGWGGAVLEARATKKRISEQVYIDIHPNLIESSDGARATGNFSSESHFVANLDKLQAALEQISNRTFENSNRIVALKEAAYIRLRPGAMTISQLELQAINDLANSLFIETTVVIVDECAPQLHDQSQGVQA